MKKKVRTIPKRDMEDKSSRIKINITSNDGEYVYAEEH